MASSKFFKSKKIFDHVTLITGLGWEQSYLIEGRDKALLIDGLAGVGSLRAFVRELTDLPVTLVNTHGHVDHIGANFEYGQAYIAPDDVALMYRHSGQEMRLDFAKSGGMFAPLPVEPRLDDVTVPGPVKTLPLYDGTRFDLGGVCLETIAVPGHTKGTVVFLDRDLRVVYSGDACNRNTLVYGEESTSIEAYRESLLHFKSYQPAFDALWGGHGGAPEDIAIIDSAIALCDEIMAGTDDSVESVGFTGRPCWYGKAKNERFQRLDGGIANIAYAKDRIWKKDLA
ncbi:MBL fold metallo-hydrolase [Acutalibacter caecimuris]|uniref:MBL fold metallo-hydrolase n=1 Tax=Acutalibacter caecimuris TaxID=3093657 RepID=UPI002AC9D11D|nr:MBL fold metallo-hydrolase [Acutalibacter sp. M00118]